MHWDNIIMVLREYVIGAKWATVKLWVTKIFLLFVLSTITEDKQFLTWRKMNKGWKGTKVLLEGPWKGGHPPVHGRRVTPPIHGSRWPPVHGRGWSPVYGREVSPNPRKEGDPPAHGRGLPPVHERGVTSPWKGGNPPSPWKGGDPPVT